MTQVVHLCMGKPFICTGEDDIAVTTDPGIAELLSLPAPDLDGWTPQVVTAKRVAMVHPEGWEKGTGYLSRRWAAARRARSTP